MAFLGKTYKLEKQENIEGYANALGVSAEIAQSIIDAQISQKYEKNGDSYVFTFIGSPVGTREVTFKSGVEVEEKISNNVSKTTITIDGNTVTHVQNFDGKGQITTKKEFNGDKLVESISTSTWPGPAIRYYSA